MDFLDDQGRVFGVVNVIDLFAILFAIAVVAAGVTLVFSGDSSENPELDTRYVTIDLGKQPRYVTERIDTGDRSSVLNAPENLTITDVYVTPAGNQSSMVTVRARLTGQLRERQNGGPLRFTFDGEPLVLGRQLTVEMAAYRASGTVTAVDTAGESLEVSTTDIVLTTTMPAEAAAAVSVEDRYRVNGQTLATVASMTAYPGANLSTRRVHLGLSLRTIERYGQPQFGGQAIRLGQSLSITLGPYDVNGRVTHLGRTSLPGEVTTTTAVVKLTDVPPDRAANIRTGLTETVGGTQYAEITDVRSESSEVVLTGDSGTISSREHPRNVDLYLTVELRTREADAGLLFHGEPVRLNEEITFDFDSLSVRGVLINESRVQSSSS